MDEESDYIVTPTTFDVSISAINSSNMGFEPERVFGSPGHEIPTQEGTLFFADSIFPSLKSDPTMTKGGVIVVKLKSQPNTNSNGKVTLRTVYKDRNDNVKIDEENIDLSKLIDPSLTQDFFQDNLVRKSVLLVRYVNFMKIFLHDTLTKKEIPSMNETIGIPIPKIDNITKNGVAAMEKLSPNYSIIFKKFITYFEHELSEISDPQLNNELEKLIAISNV